MAGIDRERWRHLEPLLDQALMLSTEARAAWLRELAATLPDLADDLTACLTADAAADRHGFLVGSTRAGTSARMLERCWHHRSSVVTALLLLVTLAAILLSLPCSVATHRPSVADSVGSAHHTPATFADGA